MKPKYETDIVLGQRYRDMVTGWEGYATGLFFWHAGTPTVQMERRNADGTQVDTRTFQAGRLTNKPLEEGAGDYL